jgi:two-component system, OmpR family, alkaline phosphatase synthesis response regulator PhoP
MPGKVLVIDDDPNAVSILQIILEDKGYEMIWANDGETAIQKVYEQNPDVIMLDVMMPGMDGYQVCEVLKNNPKTKDIPVIMLTAKDMGEDVEKALSKKVDWYIAKPYDSKYLVNKIETFIKKRREKENQSAT